MHMSLIFRGMNPLPPSPPPYRTMPHLTDFPCHLPGISDSVSSAHPLYSTPAGCWATTTAAQQQAAVHKAADVTRKESSRVPAMKRGKVQMDVKKRAVNTMPAADDEDSDTNPNHNFTHMEV